MKNASAKKQLTYEFPLPNREMRLKELIIYISDKCANNPKFSATMLNKILWASDFIAYQRSGVPITGEKYQRLEHGPAPVRLKPLRTEMERDGDIFIRKIPYHGKTQHRIMPKRSADLSFFNGDDISLVDSVIACLCNMNSTEISDWSHMRAWQTRYNNDPMPYESCLLSDDPVTPGDISRTEELSRKYRWDDFRFANS